MSDVEADGRRRHGCGSSGPIGAVARRRRAARHRRRREPRAQPRGRLPRPVRRPRWPSDVRPLRRGPGRCRGRGSWACGSIYAKTVRDSRRAALVVGGLGGLFMLATGAPYGLRVRRRWRSASSSSPGMTALPLALRGLLGEPINIETLGGFISWRVGNFLPVILGLWSVIALSGTLAGEAAKGSLDLLASTPHEPALDRPRRSSRGHVTALIVAMAASSRSSRGSPGSRSRCCRATRSRSVLPLGQALLYGLLMLAAGSLAFATAPFVGRTRAARVRADRAVRRLSHQLVRVAVAGHRRSRGRCPGTRWTAGHRPLAGRDRLALARAARGGRPPRSWRIGVVAFERRDIGDSAALRWLRLPSLPAGDRRSVHAPAGGPCRRSPSRGASASGSTRS